MTRRQICIRSEVRRQVALDASLRYAESFPKGAWMERTPSRTRCRDCQSRVVGTFCELDERNLGILDRGKSHHPYKRGQVLFHEGTPALGIYCLRSGRAKTSC